MLPLSPDRRELFLSLSGLGIGSATFCRALAQSAAPADNVTLEMVQGAEWVAGISLSEKQRLQVAAHLTRILSARKEASSLSVPIELPPATLFQPEAAARVDPPTPRKPQENRFTLPEVKKPDREDDLAFLPLLELSSLVRTRQITALELTELYLKRLKQSDPLLKCVVTLTEEIAVEQAKAADRATAAGQWRGPLHGIPWGAKDLISVPGTKTTWGADAFREQTLPVKATVVQRLEEAGAVLTAKLSLGALAWGDRWFGGQTRNPWNLRRGSSGSSAGSAAAVAAGAIPFALGSETLGSIISPAAECGVTGLRPTFGRVSRHGCMALAWSMDKIGPIARTVEDCACILHVIQGQDARDPTVCDRPFPWPCPKRLEEIRVGILPDEDNEEARKVLKDLRVRLVPFQLPQQFPLRWLQQILFTEAASAFDDFVRQGKLEGVGELWPPALLSHRFTPAVDYLRAQRLRTLLCQEMARRMQDLDLYLGGGDVDLIITNLTGQPSITIPGPLLKFPGQPPRPSSIRFSGRLFGESEMLAVAKAVQDAMGFHRRRPPFPPE